MAVTIVATPNSASSNSYITLAEFTAYLGSRMPFDTDPLDADDPGVFLVVGTRMLDALFRGAKTLVVLKDKSYYRIGRRWLGSPSTATQRLAWGRTGLYHDNGALIAADEIPWELKDALGEFAGQLAQADRTLDNDVAVQGIQSVKAGSVAVSFKDMVVPSAVLPQAVIDLIPPSWYTEELDEPTQKLDFATVLP